jgi:hypothetical protein
MTRMWMVDPQLLCRKHLLAEHNELHKVVGSLRLGRSIRGYLVKRILEPRSIRKRHAELVKELRRRGYQHLSPLPTFTITRLSLEEREVVVCALQSANDLIHRCVECSQNFSREERGESEWETSKQHR